MFSQVVNKAVSSTPFLHSLAERGVELDATVESESSNRPMVEHAGSEECLRYGCSVINGAGPRCVKAIPHTVIVTQCRQSIETTRQNPLARKELQHSLGASANCAFPYSRVRDGARV